MEKELRELAAQQRKRMKKRVDYCKFMVAMEALDFHTKLSNENKKARSIARKKVLHEKSLYLLPSLIPLAFMT